MSTTTQQPIRRRPTKTKIPPTRQNQDFPPTTITRDYTKIPDANSNRRCSPYAAATNTLPPSPRQQMQDPDRIGRRHKIGSLNNFGLKKLPLLHGHFFNNFTQLRTP
jgi:hypothetical protein